MLTIGQDRLAVGAATREDHCQCDVLKDRHCKHGVVVVALQLLLLAVATVESHVRTVPAREGNSVGDLDTGNTRTQPNTFLAPTRLCLTK